MELVKDANLVKTFEEMQKIVEGKSSQIVDTRRPPNFLGELPEPSESEIAGYDKHKCSSIFLISPLTSMKHLYLSVTMKTVADRMLPEVKGEEMIGGHMKNAKNIPYITLFKPNSSKQLSKEEYQQSKFSSF